MHEWEQRCLKQIIVRSVHRGLYAQLEDRFARRSRCLNLENIKAVLKDELGTGITLSSGLGVGRANDDIRVKKNRSCPACTVYTPWTVMGGYMYTKTDLPGGRAKTFPFEVQLGCQWI